MAIGRCGFYLFVQRVGAERRAARNAQNVLRQNIEPAILQSLAIEFARHHRIACGLAFQYLEAVCGNEQRARRLIEAVIGPPDALHQSRGTLRRADADDAIDRAPVYAQIERGGTDNRAQRALRHRRFHLAALRRRERAMMQRDGEIVVIHAPQILKRALGLRARVDEDERGAAGADRIHHFGHGVTREMTGPRHMRIRRQNGNLRLRGTFGLHQYRQRLANFRLRHEKALQRRGIGDRRGKSDAAMAGRELFQSRQSQREQIAAFGIVDGVQFVEHHRAHSLEQSRGFARGEQQRELLRRRQQKIWRGIFLPLAARGRRVARARFDADGQVPSPQRGFPDCARHPPPAPSAARYKACAAVWACARVLPPARSGLAGIRPASCRRRWAPPAARIRPVTHGKPAPIGTRAAASPGRRTSPKTNAAGAADRAWRKISRPCRLAKRARHC